MRDENQDRCRVCAAPLAVAVRGRPPVYCSRSCQAKAYRRRAGERGGRAAAAAAGEPLAGGAGQGRRRQIAEAVWRIAAERGLEAASMREVAAEAGVSLRVVQYHFGSKHGLLVSALHLLHEENDRRARARMAALPDPADLRAVLGAVLNEFLPLDEQRRSALRVFVAYYVRSLTDPALAEVFLHASQPVEQLVAGLIAQAGAAPGTDPGREADLLVSGVTGLGMDVLHGRRTLADVRTTLDYHLGRILPVH
ncbi:TetR/AcrR family transcriptional regulator [Streptomyces rectiverticillatus]|uniref:TetR/AcrR family transcriptional regulator n=1 Tax=Streptomyces rectiverticillatus TaxID=173860 RepID=UPI001C4B9ABD|nr:TetR/AcrR family transcriptional regulator [Streptomyces rectiverticillatus]QLE70598.1 TetR/AcrR family transcriptional regulator [Streptomyces rectiverticillatus]